MAIAFVKNGGTNGDKVGGNTTLSLTVPAGGHALGNLVVVAVGYSANQTSTTTAVSDSRGNTYTLIEEVPTATSGLCALWVSVLTTALQAGDSITVTITGGGTPTFVKSAVTSAEFSGASSTEDVASAQGRSASTTTPSAGPITPPSAATLVIGAVGPFGPTGDTFTQDSDTAGGVGWTAGATGGTTGGSAATNITVRLAYKITTSSASQTYNPTLGTARECGWVIAALQQAAAAAPGPASSRRQRRASRYLTFR